MYGIMTESGNLFLCHYSTVNESYVLKRRDRSANLVMKSSATEIDQLLQDYSVASTRYDLVVFQFSEEEEQKMLITKLKGH